MVIKEHVILPIDFHMEMIEYIFKKYLPYPSSVWYVKGYRFPIENRKNLDTYLARGLASNNPWYPILALGCLQDAIECYQLQNSTVPEYFKVSPVLNSGKIIYQMDKLSSLEDIVIAYINNINEQDLSTIVRYFDIMLNECLGLVVDKYSDNILTLDVETNQYVLMIGPNIKEYRLDEAVSAIRHTARSDDYG